MEFPITTKAIIHTKIENPVLLSYIMLGVGDYQFFNEVSKYLN